MKYTYPLLLALFLLALIASAILSFVPTPEVCNLEAGCYTVQTSSYNSILGIKNSYLGMLVFLAGIILIYSQIKNPSLMKRKLILAMTIAGAGIAILFLAIQMFILHAFCKYCLVVDLSMIAALATILFHWKK
ncbi:MAG: vitamin K epoxide reductase family protein [Candidatus Pacearchaeota archaeon]|nr:vitamin K epoxide reductase family protein [Candidatus Pacearchaeota archaeon]